jgi:hypothetical protein
MLNIFLAGGIGYLLIKKADVGTQINGIT